MDPYKSLNFTKEELCSIAEEEKYFLRCRGCVMRVAGHPSVNQPPTTLFPSPFPKRAYEEAIEVQRDFQRLYFRASCDYDFIRESLKKWV